MVSLAQIAKPLSVLAVIIMIGLNNCSRIYGYIFGITQLVFMIIYAVTVFMSIVFLFSQQDNKLKYILSIISNSFGTAFILMFELWWFWV